MPGSGKSTLGKQLARKLNATFIDLDHEIERHEQRTVSEIFEQSGEAFFREVESKLLREFASSSASFVMATGGGAPVFHDGMKVINESGVSVFLDVPIDMLVRHTAKRSTRPLLKNDSEQELHEKLSNIRSARLHTYQQAQITIQNPTLPLLLSALKLGT